MFAITASIHKHVDLLLYSKSTNTSQLQIHTQKTIDISGRKHWHLMHSTTNACNGFQAIILASQYLYRLDNEEGIALKSQNAVLATTT